MTAQFTEQQYKGPVIIEVGGEIGGPSTFFGWNMGGLKMPKDDLRQFCESFHMIKGGYLKGL